MTRLIQSIGLLTAVVLIMGFSSCNEDDVDEPVDTFEKEEMLANLADEVIVPAYVQTSKGADELLVAVEAIENDPSAANLQAARDAFENVQVQWQSCALYEFGPAADENLRRTVNTFPADTMQIERNIREGNTDLSTAINSDAKGLPALDYLLFGPNSTVSDLSDARVQQMLANAQLVQERLETVLDRWSNGYRDEFSKNVGNDVGSSLGQLVNELNYEVELVKNARVGIPLGKKSLGVPQEEKVEAIFSGLSVASIEAALAAQKTTFEGAEGLGLDDYLDHLDARYSDQTLSQAISDHFDEASAYASAIDTPLPEAIIDQPNKVEAVHNAIQNLVVLLKTDMPSQLGVQITYQDNDGD